MPRVRNRRQPKHAAVAADCCRPAADQSFWTEELTFDVCVVEALLASRMGPADDALCHVSYTPTHLRFSLDCRHLLFATRNCTPYLTASYAMPGSRCAFAAFLLLCYAALTPQASARPFGLRRRTPLVLALFGDSLTDTGECSCWALPGLANRNSCLEGASPWQANDPGVNQVNEHAPVLVTMYNKYCFTALLVTLGLPLTKGSKLGPIRSNGVIG